MGRFLIFSSLGALFALVTLACSSGGAEGGTAGASGTVGTSGGVSSSTAGAFNGAGHGGQQQSEGGASGALGLAGNATGGSGGAAVLAGAGGSSPGTAGSAPASGASAGASQGGSGGSAGEPSAQAGAPAAGGCGPRASYRNLFVEVLSKTEAEVEAKVEAAFESLFHGGGDKTVYYERGDEAYILDVNNNDVRSEGISYGMTIAVQLDKKEEFTKLWRFAKQHMAEGGNNAGLFTWRTNAQGQATASGSAPDGEEYFATALIFASNRWGDGAGIENYSNEARIVLDAMANKGLFDRQTALVKFLRDVNYTDPSYILPAFYEVWACFDERNREFWRRAVSAGRAFFPKTTHAQTGLAPYLANYDGSPSNALAGGNTFQSDVWRVVGNIMMDHNLFAADPWQETWAAKYAAFFASTNPSADEFNLDGTIRNQHGTGVSKGLVSQNALVAFGVPKEVGAPFLEVLWELDIPSGQFRYYDGMLYMLAMLHASGNFRLWQ